MCRILNLCLQTKDVPQTEKPGIVKGLPKTEGLVTSTDDIRPITVGPAMNRLFHRILAGRLSTVMVENKMIDRTQSAFIPGGDIHEPINAAAACYRDRELKKKDAMLYTTTSQKHTIRSDGTVSRQHYRQWESKRASSN